jgi:hypothetical protein
VAGTPTWQAATSGQPPLAAHINQLLGTHTVTVLYTGVERAAQNTAGSGFTASNSLYVAQSFTTAAGQTAIGYLGLTLDSTASAGADLLPWTVSIYANSGSAPTGAPLVTATVTVEYVVNSPTVVIIPTPVTGLSPSTTYWIVTTPAGDAVNYYEWYRSNQTTGASTSTNGTTWSAQPYGLLYQVWDQTPALPQVGTWEDDGARWTTQIVNGSEQITTIAEYTAGQSPGGYMQSIRDINYSGNLLTGVF